MPELSRDRLTWTFRLKEGLRYAPPLDDVEITAADVVRGIERTAKSRVSDGTYSTYYSVILGYDAFALGETDTIPGLEVVDDHTLAVHLTEVTNDLGYRLALPGSAPIPESPRDPNAPYGVAEGHDKGYGPYLIASGPYMIQGADRLEPSKPAAAQPRPRGLTHRSLTLVRNPSWDRSTDEFRGAYVDRIEFRVMDQKEAERRIAQGTIDTMFDGLPSAKVIERYLADPELASRVERDNVDFFSGYTAMNLAVPPFDDVHVRRAVNLAYEADRWIRVANRHADFFGFGPLGHVAPDATEDDLLRGERLYPFDPAAAREEMARSRYDGNRDGICDDPACKDVFALETDTGFEKFADRVWVEDLKAIGITLDIRRVAHTDKYTQMSLDPTTKVALNLGGVLDRGLSERLESLRHPLHIGGNRGAGLRERVARGSEPPRSPALGVRRHRSPQRRPRDRQVPCVPRVRADTLLGGVGSTADGPGRSLGAPGHLRIHRGATRASGSRPGRSGSRCLARAGSGRPRSAE